MTEAEWLTATDPKGMIDLLAGEVIRESGYETIRTPVPEFLRRQACDRKFRLVAIAWYRRLWPLLSAVGQRVIEVAERQADSQAGSSEAYDVRHELYNAQTPLGLWAIAHEGLFAAERAHEQIWEHIVRPSVSESQHEAGQFWTIEVELEAQAAIVRDVFGNPFNQVILRPAWRSESVVSLARAAYEARNFTLLPILADALEEAGCDNADVLSHCRGPGPHVRGCWVLDELLGKEKIPSPLP